MATRMAAYELTAGSTSLEGLRRVQRLKPMPGPHQVLVRLRAASLNYRDLAIACSRYSPVPLARNTVPLSDGAGEVESVGEEVRCFRPGARVVATRRQRGLALGVPLDGTLRQYAVFDEDGLLTIPECLTFEEAATLPVAAVTAWNAVYDGRPLRAGDTVLTLGVGGVSVFALQFAKAGGARVIVTSSSDEKLEQAKSWGADEVINYSGRPDWASVVLDLTGGAGVAKVIELFGAATLPQSLAAVGQGGEIALVAESTRATESFEPYELIRKAATIRGVACGEKHHFEQLNAAIAGSRIRPVIDSVYPFDRALEAYRHMLAGRHVGKIVVSIQD